MEPQWAIKYLGVFMNDNFSNSQTTSKQVVSTKAGVVSAQHRRAAEVGAAVLEEGGDAVDAAIATSFALGVVEPWMSGPAAGGAMVIWRAKEAKAKVINFGCRSPRELNPDNYPLMGNGKLSDLFHHGCDFSCRTRSRSRDGFSPSKIWPNVVEKFGDACRKTC
jgi:gamma-glutamyltranspeptidase